MRRYFSTVEGRGHSCSTDHYDRDDLQYFFSYPENYSEAALEWNDDVLEKKIRKPAFEVIFVYSKAQGTLDIFFEGGKKTVKELLKIFVKSILKADIADDGKDKKVYDLNHLKSRHCELRHSPESGIKSVRLKSLRLGLPGKTAGRIVLEADSSEDPEVDSIESL